MAHILNEIIFKNSRPQNPIAIANRSKGPPNSPAKTISTRPRTKVKPATKNAHAPIHKKSIGRNIAKKAKMAPVAKRNDEIKSSDKYFRKRLPSRLLLF